MATKFQISAYETTRPLINALYEEMQELSKKRPEATLSSSKVTLINRLLEDVRLILEKEPNFKYLDLLESDLLPQNSDVVLILSQYNAALNSFARTHQEDNPYSREREWITTGK